MPIQHIASRRIRHTAYSIIALLFFTTVAVLWAAGDHPATDTAAPISHIDAPAPPPPPPAESVVLEAELAACTSGPAFIGHNGAASGLRFLGSASSTTGTDEQRGIATPSLPFHLRSAIEATVFLRCARPSVLPSGQPSALSTDVATIRVKLDDAASVLVDSLSLGHEWTWLKSNTTARPSLAAGVHTMTLEVPSGLAVDQILLSTDSAYKPQGVLEHTARSQWVKEQLYFNDRFMQSAADATQWQTQSGAWRITEVTTSPRKDAEHSANAFSFACVAQKEVPASAPSSSPGQVPGGEKTIPGLALAGQVEWRNYTIQAAVRPRGVGRFGLVLCWQNPQNYYAFRCPAIDVTSPDGTAPVLELVRVKDGVEQVLASAPGAVSKDRWYQIEALADGGCLSASLDGIEQLRTHDFALLAGKVGLFSDVPAEVMFDDVLVRSVRTVEDNFRSSPGLEWSAKRGAWQPGEDGLVCRSRLSAFCLAPLKPAPQHTMQVDFTSHAGAVGLIYDWRDDQNYAFAAWSAGAGARLVEVRNGVPIELASSSDGYKPDVHHTISLQHQAAEVRVGLDGRMSLRAAASGEPTQLAGLYAEGASGAVFHRFELRNAQEPGPRDRANNVFVAEDTMRNWADAATDWRPGVSGTASVLWSNKRYYGDCSVVLNQSLNALRGVALAADGSRLSSGYLLAASPSAAGTRLELYRRGILVKDQEVQGAVTQLTLERRGQQLTARTNDQKAFDYADVEPLAGSSVAVYAEGNPPNSQQVQVSSANVDDFYFGDAPVDWRPDCGQWEMTNRWDCSPQWSWYGATTDEAAVLWNRESYIGDQSIDLFASFKMLTGKSVYYRTGDINLTFCADGRSLDSGYSLIYGAWGGGRTVLLRKGEVVAQTTDLAFLPPQLQDAMPGTNELHRRWFWLSLTRQGNRILCSVDGVKALEYEDPEPLDGTRFAVWTMSNWIMVARARVAYTAKGVRENPLTLPDHAVAAQPTGEKPKTLAVTSAAHPCLFSDYERDLGGWERGSSDGVELSRVARGDGGHALRICAHRSGLREAASFKPGPIDLAQLRNLSFDYRVTPEAKLHFYLRIGGSEYAVQFAGPIDPEGSVPVVAAISGVVADSRWHRVELRLAEALQHLLPAGTPLAVEKITVGSFDFPGYNYEEAGIGANPAGTTLEIDNFCLLTPSSHDPEFALNPSDGPAKSLKLRLDTRAYSLPDEVTEPAASRSYANLKDGTWYLHATAEAQDGSWTAISHYPVKIDRTAPELVSVEPAVGNRTGSNVFTLHFRDDGAGINWQALKLVVDDFAVQAGHESLALDPATETLRVDVERLPLELRDGDVLAITVESLADLAGNPAPSAQTLKWRIARKLDHKGPTILSIKNPQIIPLGSDFEDASSWSIWRPEPNGGVSVTRTAATAAGGSHALKIVATQFLSPFAFGASWPQFDARDYPILSFDYRAGPGLRTDLFFAPANASVKFLDHDNPSRKIGMLDNVVADNSWRHVDLDLRKGLQSTFGAGAALPVSKVWFADTQRIANSPLETLYLDSFRLIPLAKQFPLTWEWTARDISGVAGYAYSLSHDGAAPAWQSTSEPRASVEKLPPGRYDFLVKCVDGAGNASVSSPISFVVE